MKGVIMLLKSFGLEITDQQIAELNAVLPQLPAKINEVVHIINTSLQNFDQRLRAIELQQAVILEVLNHARTSDGGIISDCGNGTRD